jgi:hypothetical protein
VVRGAVKAILYDLDDQIIKEVVLEEGDCSMTFRGGHNYQSMAEGSMVYEYKTGPYLGQERDKVFIDTVPDTAHHPMKAEMNPNHLPNAPA